MLMNEIVVYVALVLFGLTFGSFAGATVWRLRAKQLAEDKKLGEEYDKKEYGQLKKLLGKGALKDRSRCLHCGYELKWYDLIPLVSWVSLGGKCRSCKKSIGVFEPLIELGMVLFFVASYLFWPGGFLDVFDVLHFGLWLIAGVIMAVLFAYDYKWFLLPDRYSLALSIVGVAIIGVTVWQVSNTADALNIVLSALGSVLVLGGLYGLLYFGSQGRWVGFGDVKLGIGLGLLLLTWPTALWALFLANLLGTLVVVPLLATKKLKRNARVPFGPLLILGSVLAFFTADVVIEWYLSGFGLY